MFNQARWFFFLLPLVMGCVQVIDVAPRPKVKPQPMCFVDLHSAQISGGCWDAGCSAPDPLVQLWVGDEMVFRTKTEHNTFSPQWNQRNIPLTRSQVIRSKIVLADNDGKSTKQIAAWAVQDSWITYSDEGQIIGAQYQDHSAHLVLSIKCKRD